MTVEMNSKIITKNHAADSEIEFLEKSISKPNGYETAMPTTWELTLKLQRASISLFSPSNFSLISSFQWSTLFILCSSRVVVWR